jgi:hypothetical protein
MKRIGSAVSGLDDNRAEMLEKSNVFVGKGRSYKGKTTSLQPAAYSLLPRAYINKTASVLTLAVIPLGAAR